MLHQVNNVVKVLERKSTVRERLSYFTWLVPGFKDVRHNVAEVEPRREEAAGEHEYISEKDDGIMLRAMRTVFRTLGLDRNATKQEQECGHPQSSWPFPYRFCVATRTGCYRYSLALP